MKTRSVETPPERKSARERTEPRQPREGAEWLTPAEAAFMLGCAVQTLAKWRVSGFENGPPWYRSAPRIVRYARADVDAFLRRNGPVSSTTEADARDRPQSAA